MRSHTHVWAVTQAALALHINGQQHAKIHTRITFWSAAEEFRHQGQGQTLLHAIRSWRIPSSTPALKEQCCHFRRGFVTHNSSCLALVMAAFSSMCTHLDSNHIPPESHGLYAVAGNCLQERVVVAFNMAHFVRGTSTWQYKLGTGSLKTCHMHRCNGSLSQCVSSTTVAHKLQPPQ
jgi:hypothetical protein